MTVTMHRATLPSGVTLDYAARGDRDGTPVVMLHGYADSWRSYEQVLGHMPWWLRAIAVTQRGHGEADKPEGGYRPSDFAADLADFLDTLAVPEAVIVGHSMGATIARRFAEAHPERTLGLVLSGAFHRVRGNEAVRELAGAVLTLSDPVDPGFVRDFQLGTLARPIAPDVFTALVGESLKVRASVWRAALGGLIDEDGAEEPGRIAAPTLILWGARDALAPRWDQEALAAEIAAARLTVYPECGHAPHWEEPARFALDLAGFIAGRVLPTIEPSVLRTAA